MPAHAFLLIGSPPPPPPVDNPRSLLGIVIMWSTRLSVDHVFLLNPPCTFFFHVFSLDWPNDFLSLYHPEEVSSSFNCTFLQCKCGLSVPTAVCLRWQQVPWTDVSWSRIGTRRVWTRDSFTCQKVSPRSPPILCPIPSPTVLGKRPFGVRSSFLELTKPKWRPRYRPPPPPLGVEVGLRPSSCSCCPSSWRPKWTKVVKNKIPY